jgi:hypothetical protein
MPITSLKLDVRGIALDWRVMLFCLLAQAGKDFQWL